MAAETTSSDQGTATSPSLAQIKSFLQTKDDTSRFVGLALLKSVLDNDPQLRGNPDEINALWRCISPRFLDRLLRAGSSSKISKDDAKHMKDIAVAILHTFAVLLPSETRKEKHFIGRSACLCEALINCSTDSTLLILQTLVVLASFESGAVELLKLDDLSPIVELAVHQPLVLDIFKYAWVNASTNSTNEATVRASIDKVIPNLLILFRDTDAVTLLAFIAATFPRFSPEILPLSPLWLQPLVSMIRKLVTSRPTLVGRSAYTEASSALLHAYPHQSSISLFARGAASSADQKPFVFLFINLLLIDIRSSFPSLLSVLNSSEYPAVSQRLAAAFDVVSTFVGYLLKSLDEDEDDESLQSSLKMPPDLLLRLRKDIAETLSLSIEYLRDRWDASVAGAAGLHPSARSGTATTSEGSRLTLTWESMTTNVADDALILACVRTLSIWLREDENENLRNEGAGVLDMFIELYESSHTSEFKLPVLLALQGILATEDGLDKFLELDGWSLLSKDLESIRHSVQDATSSEMTIIRGEALRTRDASRGIEVIRVMLVIVDHEATSEPREEWMKTVLAVAGQKLVTQDTNATIIEFEIALIQLSVALLKLAPRGMRKRYMKGINALRGLSSQLEDTIDVLEEDEHEVFQESLDDVVLDLENL